MVNRRDFLYTAGSLGLASILSGCSQNPSALEITLLKGSIPPQLINQFRRSLANDQTVNFHLESQLNSLYKLLNLLQKEPSSPSFFPTWFPFTPSPPIFPHLLTLGHYWLPSTIQSQEIAPLPLENLASWSNLPPSWQNFVTHNGQIWGAPYRWGVTAIAYRRDKLNPLSGDLQDWSDLWNPELKGRIAVIDQPREIIGLTLKNLGYSYNTPDPQKIPSLKAELKQLNQHIKFYSSQHYLQPLILGDIWVAVGWSNEILPITKSNDDIDMIIPRSGTALWTDLWVQTQKKIDKNLSSLTLDWIDFCWQPLGANLISLFTSGTSPIILTLKANEIKKDLKDHPLVNLSPDLLEKCELIQPLSPKINQIYQQLWIEMRSS